MLFLPINNKTVLRLMFQFTSNCAHYHIVRKRSFQTTLTQYINSMDLKARQRQVYVLVECTLVQFHPLNNIMNSSLISIPIFKLQFTSAKCQHVQFLLSINTGVDFISFYMFTTFLEIQIQQVEKLNEKNYVCIHLICIHMHIY